MKNPFPGDMRVFEFNAEDELADLASAIQLRKFKNPTGPTLNDHSHSKSHLHAARDGEKLNDKEISAELNTIVIDEKVPAVGVSSHGLFQSDSYLSDDVKGNLNPDDDESTSGSSPPSYDSEVTEDSKDDNKCFGRSNSNEGVSTAEVVLYPEYVIYQDNYYTGPELKFSQSCLKINCLLEHGEHRSFIFERAIDDLVKIRCQLYQDIETVMIILHVISTNVVQLDNACGTSGIEELKIAVVEPNWSLKYRQITSLNVKYLAMWNDALEEEVETEGDESPVQRHCFPTFDEPFDEVIYPKGDPDAVSLSKRDIDVLQPNTFLNDTIIDFYIKYLKNQIPPEEIRHFHFFNSFFFRKLADFDTNPSAFDGMTAFLRVRKWTRKVDLFEKDYIFIPVNFRLHWSLIVICHPGEVIDSISEDLDNSSKMPCILHMDSIKGSHSGLKNLLQSYLWEEWKERSKEAREDISSRFSNMHFLSLELPQQENLYDCGLFLLHYLELFLAEAPLNFNPFKISKSSNFLNADWFPPAEASLKRTLIQSLIFQLLHNRSLEVSSSDCSDDHRSTEYVMNKNNDSSVEFLSERSDSEIKENPTHSCTGDGINMTLSAASSLNPQSVSSSGILHRELFDTGATAGSLINKCHKPPEFQLYPSAIQIVEGPETGEQYMHLTTGDTDTQQMDETTSPTYAWPFRTSTVIVDTSSDPEIAEHDEDDTSEEISDCASYDSEGIRNMQANPTADSLGPVEDKQDSRNCVPKQNIMCLTEITGTAFTNLAIASYSSKDIELLPEDEHIIDVDASKSPEGQTAKRMRLTPTTAILSVDTQ